MSLRSIRWAVASMDVDVFAHACGLLRFRLAFACSWLGSHAIVEEVSLHRPACTRFQSLAVRGCRQSADSKSTGKDRLLPSNTEHVDVDHIHTKDTILQMT